MNFAVSTSVDGSPVEVVKDGVVILEKNADLTFEIKDLHLKFVFRFEETTEKEELIKPMNITNANGEIAFMKITVKVDPNELNSIFLSPAALASFEESGVIHKLYLSFNARSLKGNNNNCILFLYTFFKS